MENAEGRELLENVTISDVGGSQYMIQRMAVDSPQLLSAELLQHHNGLVVDLGAGDFIPVNYTSEDLLSQDLTEEDRNLAAALVAVQLSQQQKQQQLQQDTNVIINSPLPPLVSNSSLEDNKVSLNEQQLILTDKGTSINGGYLQIVETDNIYKQALPKLTLDSREFSNAHSVHVYSRGQELQLIKSEEELDNSISTRDSDGENKSDNRSSKKSLPHKKRISRKLKKSITTTRKMHKCNLCEQIFNTTEDFNAHQTLCQTTITPIHQATFACQLCNSTFHDQLRFFEHLKAHYEPSIAIQQNNNTDDTKTVIESNKTDTLLTSLLNLTCMQCNKTFRRQRAYEAHVREFHNKEELNEFSEPEDLMAGIDVQNTVDDSKAWYHRDDELHATEEDLRELEAQEHVCHICRQPFPLRAILHQHLVTCKAENANIVKETLTNVEVKKKPKKKVTEFHCTECERVFTHKNSLVYHLRSHTGHRPHTCEQCGKSFFAASALKVHSRLHSGDKPYRCEFCGRYFRQWGDLKYHCISIHSDQKQYQCEYCGKNFARKYSLIVHRRIHTGEKNYRCEFCGKTFRASSYLQNHRRIHTGFLLISLIIAFLICLNYAGEKPHPCDVCGKRFRVRSDMKRHLRTHGRKRVGRGMSVQNDLVVTKIEQTENIESILPDGEDSTETKYKDNDNSSTVQSLQYDQDPLDNVREGNTLYVMPILIT